jgi:ABC-type nitrate/sulfonate/bicarbonate transport system, ATPase component
MSEILLSVEHLRKAYSTPKGVTEVIHNLDFQLAPGEFACIVGPSGAGKTTLLRSIAGLLPPSSGQIRFEDRVITQPPADMAVVFQEYGRSLFPWMTVGRNVAQPLIEKGVPKAERERLVADALEAVGLSANANSYPWQLSGGMQQRVAIARAVAYEPRLLLMDEPFAAVDAQTRADLEDLVRELWKRLGVTVLFVTHDIESSIYLSQRVLVLSDRPTEVLADIPIELPEQRSQLETRMLPEFGEYRARIYELVQQAKRGARTGSLPTVR